MYLLGHIGFVLFANFLIEQFYKSEMHYKKLILGFGAMLPDLIDKPIGGLIFKHGRWIGHSFIVQLIFFTLILVIDYFMYEEKYQDKLKLVGIGSAAHIILDMPSIQPVNSLWPLFGPFPTGDRVGFLMGFSSTKVIITEILGLLFLIGIGVFEKWQRKQWISLIVLVFSYLILFLIAYGILVLNIYELYL